MKKYFLVSIALVFTISLNAQLPSKNSQTAGVTINPMPDTGEWGTVKDIDGNVYKTKKFGNQVWTCEHVRVTKLNDGTPIPETNIMDSVIWRNLKTPGRVQSETEPDIQKYGYLYNWYAVNSGKLAPSGWHCPSIAEWDELINWMIANGYNYDSTNTDNKVAKAAASQEGWRVSDKIGTPGNEQAGNNRSGFNSYPSGFRGIIHGSVMNGVSCYYWSTDENAADTNNAYWKIMLYRGPWWATPNPSNYPKGCGMSVRWVKD